MKLYTALSHAPLPRSYVGKLLVICFLGTHAPLIAFAAYALIFLPLDHTVRVIAVLILVATLGGTMVTLALIRGLLSPILLAQRALQAYRLDGIRPQLPTGFKDEAGSLLTAIQAMIEHLEGALSDRERQAITDPLTQCGNRRWLTEEGDKALAAAFEQGMPLSVILFDVDHFKAINDEFGHDAGDDVLIKIVEVTRQNIRSKQRGLGNRPLDILARIGGEEFCLVLPNTDLDRAGIVAERLRKAIAGLRMAEFDRRVTASFGMTMSRGHETTVLDLLHRADQQLYAAKRSGRNKVCAEGSSEQDDARASPDLRKSMRWRAKLIGRSQAV